MDGRNDQWIIMDHPWPPKTIIDIIDINRLIDWDQLITSILIRSISNRFDRSYRSIRSIASDCFALIGGSRLENRESTIVVRIRSFASIAWRTGGWHLDNHQKNHQKEKKGKVWLTRGVGGLSCFGRMHHWTGSEEVDGVSVVGMVVGVEEGCWCGGRWLVWWMVQWLSGLSWLVRVEFFHRSSQWYKHMHMLVIFFFFFSVICSTFGGLDFRFLPKKKSKTDEEKKNHPIWTHSHPCLTVWFLFKKKKN